MIGQEKLAEIEREKIGLGISVTLKRESDIHQNGNEIRFDDGEEWIIVNPNNGARGYRWRKAYVDASNTSVSQLLNFILPYGNLYQWEKERYFNL